MADIAFHQEASADIDGIYRFSVARFGEATANAYLDGLYEAVLRLEAYPETGREEHGITPPVRALTDRSHRVYYRFDGKTVLVVRVLHHAMNAAARFGGES